MQNEGESASFQVALQRAVARKRQHPALDQLIGDDRLMRALRDDPAAWEKDGPLTLPGCLASELPEFCPPVPIIRALNENLRELCAAGAIRRRGQLARKLLNGEQFLNTQSELALARTLSSAGWYVQLEETFFDGRDADILATRGAEKRFIEVTNLALKELGGGVHGGQIGQLGHKDRVVQKIANKYREKFEVPLENGWAEHAWVALDVAKNHLESVDTFFQTLLRLPQWNNDLAAHVRRECPRLSGVVVYHSAPAATHVDVDAWCEL